MAFITEQVFDRRGNLLSENQVFIPDSIANKDSLQAKALTALSNNSDFLAIIAPTNAQVLTQVKALTRQVNALIRLEIGQLDDITGT